MLACIGEQFENGDDICGIGCCVRPGKDRIELWTRTAANEAMQVRARGRCICAGAHLQPALFSDMCDILQGLLKWRLTNCCCCCFSSAFGSYVFGRIGLLIGVTWGCQRQQAAAGRPMW